MKYSDRAAQNACIDAPLRRMEADEARQDAEEALRDAIQGKLASGNMEEWNNLIAFSDDVVGALFDAWTCGTLDGSVIDSAIGQYVGWRISSMPRESQDDQT